MGVFAITGSLTSGKSTVIKLLKRKGAIIFDVDARIHQYYKDRKSDVYKKVAFAFKEAVKNCLISRKKLAKIVFSGIEERHKLEKIVHPVIIRDLKMWINKVDAREGIFIAEVPLLFEKKLDSYFDGTIFIYVKRNNLIERIRKKLHVSKNEAIRRLSMFLSVKEKIKRADFVIDNNSDMRKLKKEVDLVWDKLRVGGNYG